jgi:hypothetical protein
MLLLILMCSTGGNVVEEISDIGEDARVEISCSRSCRQLAVECLSFLMLHIPDACHLTSKCLLDTSSMIFNCSIEFQHNHFVVTASAPDIQEPLSTALFNIERRNSMQAFCDAAGDRVQGTLIFRAVECIKLAAAATNEAVQISVQLISSIIDVMLKGSFGNVASPGACSIIPLLCIDALLDEHVDVAQSSSLCLVDPVAAWLHSLAHSPEMNWLAVSTACSLWSAGAASVISTSHSSISDYQATEASVGASVELAALALRRIVSAQPPESVAPDVVVAYDSCTAAFRSMSRALSFSDMGMPRDDESSGSLKNITAHCSESFPSHVRCGALLQLQNLLLDHWRTLQDDAKEAVLHAVETCLFDAAAGVYVAAVEVLCCIGKVDPSSAYSFGSKFLSNNSAGGNVADGKCGSATKKREPKSEKDKKPNPASSRDFALCKVLDALGDVVRLLFLTPRHRILARINDICLGSGLPVCFDKICQHCSSSVYSTFSSPGASCSISSHGVR